MIVILILLAALCGFVAVKGGLSNVARGRKYKSGTGWCVWRWTDVRSEYILRLHVVKTPWFAVCLHWINKPDPEPWLHDHPVSFLSCILRGQYAELRQKMLEPSPRYRVHRWFNFVRADASDRHRIVLTRRGTLTLCFMGPKTREWGYHLRAGHWMHWKEYERVMKVAVEANARYSKSEFCGALDRVVDDMTARFLQTNDAKIFVDEDVRLISRICGDFDDEAPTAPAEPKP